MVEERGARRALLLHIAEDGGGHAATTGRHELPCIQRDDAQISFQKLLRESIEALVQQLEQLCLGDGGADEVRVEVGEDAGGGGLQGGGEATSQIAGAHLPPPKIERALHPRPGHNLLQLQLQILGPRLLLQ